MYTSTLSIVFLLWRCCVDREKLQLERDSSQTEADIKICNGEVTMLQKELDAITATLQQLENQKEQAQKCLDELDEKVLPSHLYPWGEANIQLSPREIITIITVPGGQSTY